MDTEDFTSLSPEEEEKKIIEMLDAHVSQAQIAHKFKRNIKFINAINKKRQQGLKLRDKSMASQAFKLFKEGKSVLDVAIELGIEAPEAEEYLAQYWHLCDLDYLYALYKDLGPKLGEYIAAHKELSSAGITVDQAKEIRNLWSEIDESKRYFNSLTSEAARLSTEIPQMREQRDQLNNLLVSLKTELNYLKATNAQLKNENDYLNSMLNTIKQSDPTFQRIQQIAKEESRKIIMSKIEQMLTSLCAAISVLKNNPTLITLLFAPGPRLDDPRLRNEVLFLYTNVWNEIISSVNKQVMNVSFDNAKRAVEELHRT